MASLARRNPDSSTMLLALTAAGAVAFFAYAASQKSNVSVAPPKVNADVQTAVNAGSGGTLTDLKSKIVTGQVDFSAVFQFLSLLGLAIGATLKATGVGAPVGALVAVCMKLLSGFVEDACKYVMDLFTKSGAASIIAPKYLAAFAKHLNDHIADLAFRATISYCGHLNIHGGTVAQGVIYGIFEAPLVVSVGVTGGLSGIIRAGLYAFEKANKLVHVTDAGDGARLAAPQMFFEAANAAGMPGPLCYLLLAKMAIAAEAGVYVKPYIKEVTNALKMVVTPKTTIEEVEKAALAKFGNK